MQLTLEATPDPAIRARLLAAIDAYNDAATGRPEPVQHLVIPLRDGAGAVEGGLVGVSYYDWLFIDLLYVPPGLRGHGMGRQLVRAAEAVAARRGCVGVWLDTQSFQAPGFYGRLGYSEFARLEDAPPGHSRHWMMRTGLGARAVPGLEVHETAQPEVVAVLDRALRAFNDAAAGESAERTGPGGARAFAVVAQDAAGTFQGGLWAVSGRSWLFLDLFILAEGARRAGVGRRILAMAEAEARARGCVGVWLDSFGFQAPGFYVRNGYRVIGELPDYPAPHRRVFLAKRLAGGMAA